MPDGAICPAFCVVKAMLALDFHRGFFPLTSHPFDREDCREVPPCPALRPYVRCFWGPVARKYGLVVPDACADIIILPEGQGIRMCFCPVDNAPYISHSEMKDMFAVRFYFWALPYFQVSGRFDEESFPDLRAYLLREGYLEKSFEQRQALMEAYLLRRLETSVPGCLLDGIDLLLHSHGRLPLKEVAAHMSVSTRTAERLFRRHTGLSPKETADVIRYQTLWRRSLRPGFDLMEQVEALGYCDQAHLLNNFRRFHGLPLQEAVCRAKDVAFLQDRETDVWYATFKE